MNDNDKRIALSEEVTRAGAVSSGAEALELLLDSARVFETSVCAARASATTDYDSGAGAAASRRPRRSRRSSGTCPSVRGPGIPPDARVRVQGIAWGENSRACASTSTRST